MDNQPASNTSVLYEIVAPGDLVEINVRYDITFVGVVVAVDCDAEGQNWVIEYKTGIKERRLWRQNLDGGTFHVLGRGYRPG